MVIGIDGSRAFLVRRTGIEEYSFRIIEQLTRLLPGDTEVRLYVRPTLTWRHFLPSFIVPRVPFVLPVNWRVVPIFAPRFWTQGGLAREMFLRPVDTLFVPAHTVPFFHPKNTVVTVHGLEYEVCPEAYTLWERFYMRVSIRFSVRVAHTVIAVSENTKQDLMRLYQVPEKKITVIGEGFERPAEQPSPVEAQPSYFLFVGRVEERKNIARLLQAFDRFKEKTSLPHLLVLAGSPGHGYEKICKILGELGHQKDVQELGYISDAEKWRLLAGASAFVFPSLYEGFGLPVLEAQAAGIPVITAATSSLPEVGGEGPLYVDPLSVQSIASALEKVTQMSRDERAKMQKAGQENLNRFSWARCAEEISLLLTENT
ncbi:MAG: glycosyltransferase family 1 protein [Candidatus Moraniibacteriota bacterium]